MRRNAVLWTLAVVVTLAAASWQRRTGPSYPYRATAALTGDTVRVRLLRSQETTAPALVRIPAPAGATGSLVWRRYPTADRFIAIPMRREADSLGAELPVQPPAGKVEYYVELAHGDATTRVPTDRAVVLRYRGPVPAISLVPHIVTMFLGLLIGIRAGVGAVWGETRQRRLVLAALATLTLGGLMLGPIAQEYAFGAYWTGVPFGWDLTDNKTLFMWIGWVAAVLAGQRPVTRWIVMGAALLMLTAYVIPHSTMGSQLDYTRLDTTSADSLRQQ